MKKLLLISLLTTWSISAHAALVVPNITIKYDDGFAESSVGTIQPNIWLNSFTSNAEIEVVGASIPFGPNPGDGTPVSIYLWSDPNADGNPNDAVLLDTVNSVYSDSNIMGSAFPLNYVDFMFNIALPVTYGDAYFIGFQSTGWALLDTDNTPPATWVFNNGAGGVDPNNLFGAAVKGNIVNDGIGLPGVVPIRALAVIPEPSTYLAAISAIGLVSFVAYRRRKAITAEAAELENEA